jgi:hypothetical protein
VAPIQYPGCDGESSLFLPVWLLELPSSALLHKLMWMISVGESLYFLMLVFVSWAWGLGAEMPTSSVWSLPLLDAVPTR